MSLVWKNAQVKGSEMLVLLALADYGDDNGKHIFPSMDTLGEKARLSSAQTRRILKKLVANQIIRLVRYGGWRDGRNWANEYEILIDNIAGGYLQNATTSQDASTVLSKREYSTRVDASTVLAPVQPQSLLQPSSEPPLQHNDGDKARARGAVFAAWAQNFPGTITPILQEKILDLIDETSERSVVHGITAAVEAGARNFNYVAACARNHASGKEPPPRNQDARNKLSANGAAPRSKVQASMDAVDYVFDQLEQQEALRGQ